MKRCGKTYQENETLKAPGGNALKWRNAPENTRTRVHTAESKRLHERRCGSVRKSLRWLTLPTREPARTHERERRASWFLIHRVALMRARLWTSQQQGRLSFAARRSVMTVMWWGGRQATDIKPSLPLPDAPAVRLCASGCLCSHSVRARGEKCGNPATHRLIQMHTFALTCAAGAHTHTRRACIFSSPRAPHREGSLVRWGCAL